ncbi:MAG: OmpA family protein [Thiotrichales bacterium]|nr:OmpA family protein [Thiotrichales bacterium]
MPHPVFKKSLISLSIAAIGLSTSACAPVKETQGFLKETFASDDPCSNNARNIGILAGAIAGAVIANQLGDGPAANALGAGIGAGIGGLIGHDIDNRRCELHKIAQKYKVPIESAAITYADAGIRATNNTSDKNDTLGLKVNLQDTGEQFATGSSALTPKAKAYFTEIAQKYSPNAIKNADEKKLAQERRLLIIGHTDDVGDSNSNAILAEQRAKAVAQLFAQYDIDPDHIHYQGAGETRPIADNRTAEGRAKNRRAEIIDLPNQQVLESYLLNQKPVIAYYRPKAVAVPAKQTSAAKKPDAVTPSSTPTKTIKMAKSEWAFEGQKLTADNATVAIGDLVPREDKLAFTSLFGIGTANASSDMVYANSCVLDRPRKSGAVKSLETGKEVELKTRDYLPGLNQTVWMGDVGKHKIALLGVAVPRDAANAITPPKVNFYATKNLQKSTKPKYATTTEVNAYHGKDGVLYRVFFTDAKAPVQCMDIVMPNQQPFSAKTGYLIYPDQNTQFVATFKPKKI